MANCKKCKYFQNGIYNDNYEGVCTLTNRVISKKTIDKDCKMYNKDLSGFDICYNCKYYGGGEDWGLFCHHKHMYHHLGKFNDTPCEFYEKTNQK